MNIIKKTAIACAAMIMATPVFAGGTAGGVEPGAGCAASNPDATITPYYGAPYVGETVITPINSGGEFTFDVAFSDSIAPQQGNSGDTLVVSSSDVSTCTTIERPNQEPVEACKEFIDLTRRDLMGACVSVLPSNQYGAGFAEVLAVQNFINDGSEINATVLLLPIGVQ